MQKIRRGVEELGGDAAQPVLVFANPFQGQRLAVPHDVRPGDTPDGAPAVLWRVSYVIEHEARDVWKDGHLWKLPAIKRPDWGQGAPAKRALWAFLKLADETNLDAFVAFARTYGPLGLWPYERPDGYKSSAVGDKWMPSAPDGIQTPLRYTTIRAEDDHWALREQGLLGMYYEPVAEWQRWARLTRAVLLIALELRSGQLGPPEQWAALGIEDVYADYWRGRYRTVERQRERLSSVVRHQFLKWSGLTPALRWNGSNPEIALVFGGRDAVLMPRASMQRDWPENALFPALVAHMLAILTAGSWIAACTGCGELHPRNRKPRADQPAYCARCKNEAIRRNKRVSAAEARRKKRVLRVDA